MGPENQKKGRQGEKETEGDENDEGESFSPCGMMWHVSGCVYVFTFIPLSRSDRLSATGFERRCDGLPVTWSGCVWAVGICLVLRPCMAFHIVP